MKRLFLMIAGLLLIIGFEAKANFPDVVALPGDNSVMMLRPPQSPVFRLTGTVLCNGEPVPGVTVVVEPGGYAAVTDASGSFTFPRLPAGVYQVTVSIPGLPSATVTVVLDQNRHVMIEICGGGGG